MSTAILLLLTVSSATLVVWRPRFATYLAVLGALFPMQLKMSTDVPVLVGVLAGLMLVKFRTARSFRDFLPPMGRLWPFLLFFGSLVATTVAAREVFGGELWFLIATDTFWFLCRVGALMLIAYWVPASDAFEAVGRPVLIGAVLLALVRLGQALHLGPANTLADALPLLSDLRVKTDFNVYAAFLTIALPFSLHAISASRQRARWLYGFALVLILWSLSTTLSRTGLVTGSAVLTLLMLTRRSWRWFAVASGALLALGLFSWWNGTLGAKPVLTVRKAAPSVTATAKAHHKELVRSKAQASATRLPEAAWRAALTHPNTAIEQVIELPAQMPTKPELNLYVKRGSGMGPYQMRITVDGQLVYTWTDLTQLNTDVFDWETVPLQPEVLSGKERIVVRIDLVGKVDSTENYVEFGGFDLRSSEYSSRWFNGYEPLTHDLSPDSDLQLGTYGVLLNTRTPPGDPVDYATARKLLDQSVSERFVLWRTALQIFQDYPLFGTGLYSFRFLVSDYLVAPLFVVHQNAHNMVFQTLADQGGVGLIAWLSLFGAGLYRASCFSPVRRWEWTVIAALGAVTLFSLTQTWTADLRLYIPVLLLVSWAALQRDDRQLTPVRSE